MSAPNTGGRPPQGTPARTPTSPTDMTYNFIPDLRFLMPRSAGRPGVDYLTVSAMNLMEAQQSGFSMIVDSRMFTIQGPLGSVDCQLYGSGAPIPGLDPHSGRRIHYVDEFIVNMTGLRLTRFQQVRSFAHTGAPLPKPTADQAGPKPNAQKLTNELREAAK